MNFDANDYFYRKDWFVVKNTSSSYLIWHNRTVNPWEIIRENLDYFEAKKFSNILNKLNTGRKRK